MLEAGNDMDLTQAQAGHLVEQGMIYKCDDEQCCCRGHFYHVSNKKAGYPDGPVAEQEMWDRIAAAIPMEML